MTTIASLTAADVMQRHLLAIHQDESLHSAMSIMTSRHVTGLPVLDSNECCVGVISATDILRFANDAADSDTASEGTPHFDIERQQWEHLGGMCATERLQESRVGEFMTRDVVAVEDDTPLVEVAQLMAQTHIHRVLVCEDGRLLGLISSSDFVKVIAALG